MASPPQPPAAAGAAPPSPPPPKITWALAIHGGAGVINADDPAWIRAGLEGLRAALRAGAQALASGDGGALGACEAAVAALEDDPLFNAGRGSVLTRSGRHELEASVMVAEAATGAEATAGRGGDDPAAAAQPHHQHHHPDGGDGSGGQRCGAAALLTRVKNPVRLARAVMEATPHTFIAGEEAERLAERVLGPEALADSNDYFTTKARRAQWRRWTSGEAAVAAGAAGAAGAAAASSFLPARADEIVQQHGGGGNGDGGNNNGDQTTGTVGAVAVDVSRGELAAATSTGGRVGKWEGRVGDTPVCGAGNWADARVAVSGTGVGEAFARRCAAKDLAARVEHGGATVGEAARAVVFGSLAPGDGGVIAVDAQGNVAMPFNSAGMWRGVADSTGRFEVGVFEAMEEEGLGGGE